jgi:FkbM family methyltransferase
MNDALLARLKTAELLASASRTRRLLRSPVGMALPVLLRRLAVNREVVARTFFGRQMKVVLPEGVSTRIWRYGTFEADVAFYLISSLSPGDTFIDIGGHFGFFSMLGRELVGPSGRVVTFEPMPATRAILTSNLSARSDAARCDIIPAAAGETPGKIRFRDFGILGSALATPGEDRDGNFVQLGTIDVDVVTLDEKVSSLGIKDIGLIKIDAENAEYEVVSGARNVLARMTPNLVVETGDFAGSPTRRVLDLLLPMGYQAFEFSQFRLKSHVPQASYGYQNLLMVHERNAGRLPARLLQGKF